MKATWTNDRCSLCVRLPSRVKAALSKEAARRGTSVNDLAGSLLGERFGVEFVQSGLRLRHAACPHKPVLVLRLPRDLVEAVREHAFQRRSNLTHEVSVALAEALGVGIKIDGPRRTIPLGGGRRLIA